MSEPFSPEVATRLIFERPGRTAQEIVKDALSRGIIGSRGRDQIKGHIGALATMYRVRRIPEVWRDETSRPYRYYPVSYKTSGQIKERDTVHTGLLDRQDTPTQVISFRPTLNHDRVINALVSVGAAASRSEAVHWLIEQGIAARAEFIERALATQAQIEELRRWVRALKAEDK